MKISYRVLESLIAKLHDIAPEHRIALQGRIKHFQRNGWPGNTNTGKGHAAEYGIEAIMKLVLGFELLQFGMPPERAAELLGRGWFFVRQSIWCAVYGDHRVNMFRSSPLPPRPHMDKLALPIMLSFDPQSLSKMMLPVDGEDPSWNTFAFPDLQQVIADFREDGGIGGRRLALLSLSDLIASVINFLGDPSVWLDAIEQWIEAANCADRDDYKLAHGAYPEEQ